MLTARQNLVEVMRGGNPERFSNQYEFLHFTMENPISNGLNHPKPGETGLVDSWGVTWDWPAGQPGMFPNHTGDKVVLKDFDSWQDYVKRPNVKYSEAEWEPFIADAEAVDRTSQYMCYWRTQGIFEQIHALAGVSEAMLAFYESPDELHELIKWILEYEMMDAEEYCTHVHPDAIFHHDDWGSQTSTFMSPDMFEEFLLEPYKELYAYYRSLGVELIVHHSDSYGETLVPYMVDMGIDIWQGAMSSNDIPAIIKQYGPQITVMGGIDTALIDHAGYNREDDERIVKEVCDACGPLYFVPCSTAGDDVSTFEGSKELLYQVIDDYSTEYFKTWKRD